MADQHRLPLLVLLALLALGCRKDKESAPPTVRILEPGAGFTLNVPDTVAIRVLVSDDVAVERLVVMVADQQGVPVTPVRTVAIGQASATVLVELPVNNEALEGGNYQIIARAFDAEQDQQTFQSITLNPAPLRRRAVFLIPSPSATAPYLIHRIDSTGLIGAFATLMELQGAAISPALLYTAGGPVTDLLAWRSDASSSVLMSNAQVSGSAPYFFNPSVDAEDGRLYIGTWDGLIRGFGASGNQAYNASLTDGYQSRFHLPVGDRFLSLAYSPVQDLWRMVSFSTSSGAQLASFPLAATPVAVYGLDPDRVLLFGNTAQGGIVAELTPETGGFTVLRTFDADSIRQAVPLATGSYAVGASMGLYRYQFATSSVITLSGVEPDALGFDASSGALLAAFGTELRALDPNTGAISGSMALPQSIGQVLVQLNR
ncbi:MAG: hypothetical protein H6591_12075 [Flavobacteriales bacterium]|nr:hypothetical protein [Flavobacteriales bacterium]